MKFAVTAIALLAAGFTLPTDAGPARAAVFVAPAAAAASPVMDGGLLGSPFGNPLGGLLAPAQYYYPAPAPFLPLPGPAPYPGYGPGPGYAPGYGDGRRRWGGGEDDDGDAWRRRRMRERWCYYHPGRC
jgi:hypothetical protein